MELYVLRVDNYQDRAWENGACNLIGVYDNKEMVINKLMQCLDIEEKEFDCIFDRDNVDSIYKQLEINNYYVDIYGNEDDYNNSKEGCLDYNISTYVIEKKILNDSRVSI